MSDKKEQKKSVGIQLMGRNSQNKIVAILQVRSAWNEEKNSPETWPGACQVTAHGKLEKDENFLQGLLRELKEELGEELEEIVKKSADEKKLIELVNEETPEKHVITYGIIIEDKTMENLLSKNTSRSFGGFKVITEKEINEIVDIKNIDKVVGVTDPKIIAMFPDEKEALTMAFNKFS